MAHTNMPGTTGPSGPAQEDVSPTVDRMVRQAGFLEQSGGMFDGPALDNAARVEMAGCPRIEKAACRPVELVAEGDYLRQLFAAFVNWQLAPVETAHFAERFVGAEGVVDPVQPLRRGSQGRIDLRLWRRGTHVEGHDSTHDFFVADNAGGSRPAQRGHHSLDLSRADASDCAKASLV